MTLHVIAGHVRKIQEIGVGITAYESLNALYDFLFYPLALSYWGLTVGGIVVTTGALLINGFVFWGHVLTIFQADCSSFVVQLTATFRKLKCDVGNKRACTRCKI